jgi:hypothetical protein
MQRCPHGNDRPLGRPNRRPLKQRLRAAVEQRDAADERTRRACPFAHAGIISGGALPRARSTARPPLFAVFCDVIRQGGDTITRVRVLGVTLAIGWLVAVVVVAVVVASQYTSAAWNDSRSSFDLLRRSALCAIAITVVPGVIAGMVAYRKLLHRRGVASLAAWVAQGAGMGVLLGGSWAAALQLFLVLVESVRGTSWFGAERVLMFGSVGAIAGGLAGCVVGAWCYRQRTESAANL